MPAVNGRPKSRGRRSVGRKCEHTSNLDALRCTSSWQCTRGLRESVSGTVSRLGPHLSFAPLSQSVAHSFEMGGDVSKNPSISR